MAVFLLGCCRKKFWWVRAMSLLVNMAGCSGKFYEVRPLSLLLMEMSLGKASTQASLISWKGKNMKKHFREPPEFLYSRCLLAAFPLISFSIRWIFLLLPVPIVYTFLLGSSLPALVPDFRRHHGGPPLGLLVILRVLCIIHSAVLSGISCVCVYVCHSLYLIFMIRRSCSTLNSMQERQERHERHERYERHERQDSKGYQL